MYEAGRDRAAVLEWLITGILILALTGIPAQAAPYIMDDSSGKLKISYFDNTDGREPISGAEFTCYRIAVPTAEEKGNTLFLNWKPIIRRGLGYLAVSRETEAEGIREAVQKAYNGNGSLPEGGRRYIGKTGNDGILEMNHLEAGAYLAVETAPAAGHLASKPFIYTIPAADTDSDGVTRGWKYEAYAEPKPVPCGKLIISKTVRGNGGDQSKLFHFKVTIAADGAFHFRKSDGNEGEIRSGGTIALSHGQSAVIEMIPAGTEYEVSENEADRDGYQTDSTGSSGRIRKKTEAKAAFVNTKYKSGTTSGGGGGSGGNPGGGTGRTSPVRTGDDNRPLLLIIAAILSAGMIVSILRKEKLIRSAKRLGTTAGNDGKTPFGEKEMKQR